jgi:hypothetical protein
VVLCCVVFLSLTGDGAEWGKRAAREGVEAARGIWRGEYGANRTDSAAEAAERGTGAGARAEAAGGAAGAETGAGAVRAGLAQDAAFAAAEGGREEAQARIARRERIHGPTNKRNNRKEKEPVGVFEGCENPSRVNVRRGICWTREGRR